MRKNICIFSAQYLPHLGGVERYTYNMAKKLYEKGNNVTIVTMNEIKKMKVDNEEGIRILRLPGIQLCDERMPIIRLGTEFVKWDKYLMQQQFDLIIIQTRYYPLSLYASKYAKKKNISAILIDHSTAHIEVGSRMIDPMIKVYEHIMCSLIKKSKCDFYGVSKACIEWLRHFGIEAKGVLYNSINIEDIESVFVKEDLFKELNIPEDAKIILYAGRLVKEKGVKKLVDAMKGLEESYSQVYTVIAGDGELYEELKKKKNDKCILLGNVPHEKVIQLMKKAYIFCLPTDYPEGFPTSVLEAAACKLYVITTTAGGSKELIFNEDYGTILQTNQEYMCLKNAIENILLHPKKRKNAVENCYSEVMKRFSWDTVAEQIEKMCEVENDEEINHYTGL